MPASSLFLPPPFEGEGAGALERGALLPRLSPDFSFVLLGPFGGAGFAMCVIPVGRGVFPQLGYCQIVLISARFNSSKVLAAYGIANIGHVDLNLATLGVKEATRMVFDGFTPLGCVLLAKRFLSSIQQAPITTS